MAYRLVRTASRVGVLKEHLIVNVVGMAGVLSRCPPVATDRLWWLHILQAKQSEKRRWEKSISINCKVGLSHPYNWSYARINLMNVGAFIISDRMAHYETFCFNSPALFITGRDKA